MQLTFIHRLSVLVLLATLSVALPGCGSADSKESKKSNLPSEDAAGFNSYWYAGQAEITRYELEQARYGEMRKGDAVLIFVTEDFLRDKQVKHEFGDAAQAVPVLKMNSVKKFYTGIYPYSIMTSVFTPVTTDKMGTLKVVSSSQEWCGQTFMQFNHRQQGFDVQVHSYFQKEGDENFHLDDALLEDEVWTRIRLAPSNLPTGEVQIIPGQLFSRLHHESVRIEKATATLETTRDSHLSNGDISVYDIDYQNLERRLTIRFETAFPHRILAWEEETRSGFGPKAKLMTTRAVKTHSLKTDYWSKNKLSDSHLREELGLVY